MNRIYILRGLFLFLLGCAFYLFFRSDVLAFNVLRIHPFCFHHSKNILSNFLIYCLPDGLWFASLLFVQLGISSDMDVFMLLLCIVAPFLLEIGQIAFLPGTFDWNDMLIYLLTLIIVYLCVKREFSLFKQ